MRGNPMACSGSHFDNYNRSSRYHLGLRPLWNPSELSALWKPVHPFSFLKNTSVVGGQPMPQCPACSQFTPGCLHNNCFCDALSLSITANTWHIRNWDDRQAGLLVLNMLWSSKHHDLQIWQEMTVSQWHRDVGCGDVTFRRDCRERRTESWWWSGWRGVGTGTDCEQ